MNYRQLFWIACFLIYSKTSFAQEQLIKSSELTFFSELEKRALTSYFDKTSINPFLVLISHGALLTESRAISAETSFYNFLNELNANSLTSIKKNDKKIKLIYQSIHSRYFRKYAEGASFENIFYDGLYNHVTATAVFALAFEHLKIPYAIKQEQENLYLLVYPLTERIKLETTSPTFTVQVMSQAFKQQYIKALKEQKLITAQEANGKNIDQLFDIYYFGNQDIQLHNLIGVYYLNDALKKYDEKNYMEALATLEKAHMFYPSTRTTYMLMVIVASALEHRKEKDLQHALLVTKLSRLQSVGVTVENIQYEFFKVVQQLLFEQGKKDQFDAYFSFLKENIDEYTMLQEVSYTYHFECGRYFFNKAKYREALVDFEAALQSKPAHQDAHNALISTLANLIKNFNNVPNSIELLEKHSLKYPILHENNVFNNLLCVAYLVQSSREYAQDKPLKGESFREKFEKLLATYPSTDVNSLLVGEAYSSAAVYYYRKGVTSKAKSLIEKGLEISPNNNELLSRQRMLR